MNLLAIETATRFCSVVLESGGQRLRRAAEGTRTHAEVLLPWIGELLAEAGLDHADLDAVAVDRGPGGFTSLRIGLGVAQGIALAHDLPCHPVSSLAALAQRARPAGYAGAMLTATDARMGEVYTATWELRPGEPPCLLGCEQLLAPDAVRPPDAPEFIAAGDAFDIHRETLPSDLLTHVSQVLPDHWPDADAIATLGRQTAAVPAHRLEPVYLRDRVTG
ncbi:MAG: tRNA (adenosine(37)-N6)-threonylcarbamoyltransferase complex dimerization subunit type 1 TsaB [Wenzhouxiangellaceae bacterium]